MDRVTRFTVSSVMVSMVRVAAEVRYKLIKQFQLQFVLSYTYSSRPMFIMRTANYRAIACQSTEFPYTVWTDIQCHRERQREI